MTSTPVRLSGTRNGCRIWSTVDGRWRGFAVCERCDREVAQHARTLGELHRRIDTHECERTPKRQETTVTARTRRRNASPNDYVPFVGVKVEITPDLVMEPKQHPKRGKYMAGTIVAREDAGSGEWHLIVGGYTSRQRAWDDARKFERGGYLIAPGPAEWLPIRDPSGGDGFAIVCRYLNVRSN